MEMLLPFIATLAATCAVVYTKWIFTKMRVGYLPYTVQSFWAILFVLLPGIFYVPLPHPSTFDFFLFFVLVVFACIWNVVFYHGFKEESLVESQLVVMIVPLLSAFFGFLFFPEERHIIPLILLGGGVAALVWSHVSHHHMQWHHGSLLLLLSSFFIAAESVLVKILIPVFTVYWLYFFRVLAITFLLSLIFPRAVRPRKKIIFPFFLLAILVIIQFLFTYWSFAVHGLLYSNVVLSLIPIFVGGLGILFFHEHPSRKKLIAGCILLLCVLLAQFF